MASKPEPYCKLTCTKHKHCKECEEFYKHMGYRSARCPAK